MPNSPLRPKTKISFENKIQEQTEQNKRRRNSEMLETPTPEIESQTQHMKQWRVNHFPDNQTDPQPIRHFQPYVDDDSMDINNSNMVHFDNPRPSNPKTALNKKSGGASKSPVKRVSNHSGKDSG